MPTRITGMMKAQENVTTNFRMKEMYTPAVNVVTFVDGGELQQRVDHAGEGEVRNGDTAGKRENRCGEEAEEILLLLGVQRRQQESQRLVEPDGRAITKPMYIPTFSSWSKGDATLP